MTTGPTIGVDIVARFDGWDKGVRQGVARVADAARDMNDRFVRETEKRAAQHESAGSKIGKSIVKGVTLAVGLQGIDIALRGVAAQIESGGDRSWFDAGVGIMEQVIKGIESVPIAGGFVQIGRALGDPLYGGPIAQQREAEERRVRNDKIRAAAEGGYSFARDMEISVMPGAIGRRAKFEEQRDKRLSEVSAAGGDRATTDALRSRLDAAFDATEAKRAQSEALAKQQKDLSEKVQAMEKRKSELESIKPEDFVANSKTAIGGFRFAQPMDKDIFGENIKLIRVIDEKILDAIESIKSIVAQQDSFS